MAVPHVPVELGILGQQGTGALAHQLEQQEPTVVEAPHEAVVDEAAERLDHVDTAVRRTPARPPRAAPARGRPPGA